MVNRRKNIAILVAIPCYGGWINSLTTESLFLLREILIKKGINNNLYTHSGESFLPTVRNKIADTFLRSRDFNYLMCIDADIVFNPNDILRLLTISVDFAAGKYRLKKDKVEYCISGEKESKLGKNISEVDYVGAGFQLLSRNCFEKLIESKTIQKERGINGIDIWDFYSSITKDGFLLPEDVSFSQRWTNIGGKIYINNLVELKHFGGKYF